MDRGKQRDAFQSRHGITEQITWLPADASTRRYGRVQHQGQSRIFMDAPPNAATRTAEFLAIAELLQLHGLAAPKIIAADADAGFVVLQDLGAALFSDTLAQDNDQALMLYDLAYSTIEALQSRCTEDPKICQPFDAAVMCAELNLFRDWYCPAAGVQVSDMAWAQFDGLAQKHQQKVAVLPQRFVLRDCHVDNFIYRPECEGLERCGILDFQDGGWGSAIYDVTSLLFDARRDVCSEIQQGIMRRHAQFLGCDWVEYQPIAAYLVLQRALKVLGIFTRLNTRDAKPQYLVHLHRCWQQVQQSCALLPDWRQWLSEHMPTDIANVHATWPVDSAMLLAAGRGTRMGQLGEATPKPLLPVAGQSIIRRSQAQLRHAGVSRFVVNAHHLADQVAQHFADQQDTVVIPEQEILETGGGVRNALPQINRDVFWIVNGDSLWKNADEVIFQQAESLFQSIVQNTDYKAYQELNFALLLLVPAQNWLGKDMKADFSFDPEHAHLLRRSKDVDQSVQGYGYSGVLLLHRAAILNEPIEPFSLNRVFDQLIAADRLYGMVTDWAFYHVGTPEALQQADQAFDREQG